jgi:hypothetical protein
MWHADHDSYVHAWWVHCLLGDWPLLLGEAVAKLIGSTLRYSSLATPQIIMTVASRAASLRFPDDTPPEYAALGYACLSYDAAVRPALADVCGVLAAMRSPGSVGLQ